jgi:Uncharacterized protein conserved in bacteria
MDFKRIFKSDSVGGLVANLGITFGIIMIIAILYFFIYLPSATNHGESVTVPDLTGMNVAELERFLADHDLRYTVNDSSYSDELPPLAVLRQFPKEGSQVKLNRVIYVTLNRVTPPTLPVPDLVDRSLINAEVVLKSNELKRGRIIYEASQFQNLVLEMKMNGVTVLAGTRIPKGSTIDLVVGDGNGPADFAIGSLIGDSYERALFKLRGWNLHLGNVQIPEGVDTTGVESIVFKQFPISGDSVRVGDPVDIWIAPKGYKEPDPDDQDQQ